MAQEAALPPEVQQQLLQLQNLSAQLQATGQQRLQMEALKAESDQAIEALEALPDDAPVYRNLGSLLVREPGKDAALKRLRDDQETLEVRIKRLRSQEDALRASAQSLQQKLQGLLG